VLSGGLRAIGDLSVHRCSCLRAIPRVAMAGQMFRRSGVSQTLFYFKSFIEFEWGGFDGFDGTTGTNRFPQGALKSGLT
jgi:hypothetical protein